MNRKTKQATVDRDSVYRTSSNAPESRSAPAIEQAIGTTVRKLRKQLHLTVGELAAVAGVSVAMLSKVENGQISPSLATLEKLARGLKVPISRLFTEFDERRDCSFVPAGEGVKIDRRGTRVGHQYQVLGATLSGDTAVEPYLITLAEDATPYAGFQHEGMEFIYMLSGSVGYRHGDTVYAMKEGDALLFDSAAAHGPETLDRLPAVYLSIIIYSRG
ncbi:helix-turn-helix domain-containing protein [Eilatimonas milleporae]|uniref:XRE family transcriptional regulator n=1 Tax=Eilatimonas milleporae TaxID=911205 RepID=A0A3M0BTS4_9PROT|nr:XRE family transcriptional regulator [Eilatimonas milleporae]RMB00622.1 XRE family transcriptional regulator [Eilatimonas milleporae]